MDIKLYSYLFGLFGTDGTVYRNKTNEHIYRIGLELIDKDIIDKISSQLDNCSQSDRIRDTNFKRQYHSYTLYCNDKDFINWCEFNGFPLFDKTTIIAPPKNSYSESDFWRGVIDGDGSIGRKTATNEPFISLVTKSEPLKNAFENYIKKITNFKPNNNRNKRDGVFNITIHGEKAVKLMNTLYQDSNIYIDRKYQKYLENCNWQKPNTTNQYHRKWSEQELQDLQKLSTDEFINKYPNRTRNAIYAQRRKLKKGGEPNVNT